MKIIIFLLMLIPAFAHANYCENIAQFHVLSAFWKIDGVPKEVALERVKGLEVLYSDLESGKNQTKEFTEMVEDTYKNDYFKINDQDISGYTSNMTYGYATILATCLAEHP
ncbi:hypothetical protein [Acinetobacter bereziniae]|nr:hypothetical protein [Acinetobacter bereziniae]MCU4539318.1 hypothetical protein [Acinetobacter bereziniae]RSZ25729.1 hypothetical protein NDM229_006725 [Acinetobacter bereziniae]